jgi:hypothetical protein
VPVVPLWSATGIIPHKEGIDQLRPSGHTQPAAEAKGLGRSPPGRNSRRQPRRPSRKTPSRPLPLNAGSVQPVSWGNHACPVCRERRDRNLPPLGKRRHLSRPLTEAEPHRRTLSRLTPDIITANPSSTVATTCYDSICMAFRRFASILLIATIFYVAVLAIYQKINTSLAHSFTASPTSGRAPLSVMFMGTARGDYTLSFGDNTPVASQIEFYECATGRHCSPPPLAIKESHTYIQAGIYIAALKDSYGTQTATVTVR